MFKDEIIGKIMKEFCAPRAKTYAFKLDDNTKKKKAKGTMKYVIRHNIKLRIIMIQYLKIKPY